MARHPCPAASGPVPASHCTWHHLLQAVPTGQTVLAGKDEWEMSKEDTHRGLLTDPHVELVGLK